MSQGKLSYLEGKKFFNNSKEEVQKILFDEFLLKKYSHYLVMKRGYYEARAWAENYIEEVERITDGYRNKYQTIKVENLENFTYELYDACKELGAGTNLHMFLSPIRGTGFPEHTDERDVYIYCIYGVKRFYIDGVPRILGAGDVLYIPAGTKHRAETDGASGILSFGVPVKEDKTGISYGECRL